MSRYFIATWMPILIFAASKLIFNDEGDPTAAVSFNFTLVINAIVTMGLTFVALLSRRRLATIRVGVLNYVVLIYYILALLSSLYSLSVPLTLYWSLTGIGYFFIGIFVAEEICAKAASFEERYKLLRYHILLFAVLSIVVNATFVVVYMDQWSIANGIPSDYVALLLLLIYYFDIKINRSTKARLQFILAACLCLFLNSFSSYAAFFSAVMLYKLLTKQYTQLFFVLIVALVLTAMAIPFLQQNVGETLLFNKPAEAYLSGSGRFNLYIVAYDVFRSFNPFEMLFGVGFMAQRDLLLGHDLPWITDPHNSLIASALGLGLLGVFLYFLFVLFPLLKPRTAGGYEKIWRSFHFGFVAYGITSSYYLGRPSMLLLYAVAFYNIATFRSDK